jgi:hypothetical protein
MASPAVTPACASTPADVANSADDSFFGVAEAAAPAPGTTVFAEGPAATPVSGTAAFGMGAIVDGAFVGAGNITPIEAGVPLANADAVPIDATNGATGIPLPAPGGRPLLPSTMPVEGNMQEFANGWGTSCT